MKIFLSYASEQKDPAEQLAIALRNADHEVFFDQDDLPAGGDYNARIRDAIKLADMFIYCISPESVAEGSYARTELLFARKRFGKAVNRVLPVMLEPTPLDQVPNFAKSVTILEREGNLVSEVVQAVDRLASILVSERFSSKQAAHLLFFFLAAILLGNLVYQWSYPRFESVWALSFGGLVAAGPAVLVYGFRRRLVSSGSAWHWGGAAAACLILAGAGWLAYWSRPMVVWIVPGASVMGDIPPGEDASPFSLDVQIGANRIAVEHLSQSGVVLGESSTVVDLALNRSSGPAERILKRYLNEKQVPQRLHEAYLELWQAQRAVKTGIILRRRSEILISLTRPPEPPPDPAVVQLHGALPLRVGFVESER